MIKSHNPHWNTAQPATVAAGANVNARVPRYFYNTPLHLAAHGGHAPVVKLLIEAGANLDKPAADGSTPLLLATGNKSRNPQPARLLLQAGADPNIPNRYGRTPLFGVVMNGETALANLLLQAGADMNAADRYGATPLRFAAERGSVDIAEALLSAGADVNPDPSSLPTLYHGNTPLLAAVGGRNPTAMVALLIRHGVNVDVTDNHGTAPLHRAIHSSHGDLAKLLIEAGADVQARNHAGNTPVQVAAFAGLPEVIKLLVEAGAPVNLQDQVGDTPLHDAALQGRVEAARVLLDAGARVNAANNAGHTPLDLARQHGHETVAAVLLAAVRRETSALPGSRKTVRQELAGKRRARRRPVIPKSLAVDHGERLSSSLIVQVFRTVGGSGEAATGGAGPL